MKVDLVDTLAVLLGVFYGVQWASLRRTHSAQAAEGREPAWQRVQRAELRALTVMTSACFTKIVLDLGLQWVAPRWGNPPRIEWPMSLAIDVGWMVCMFVGLRMRASARRQRAELGMPPQEPGA